MRTAFILICSGLLSGCSFLNMAKGPVDFWRNHAAVQLKEGIDKAIQEEVRKDVPGGYKNEPYSREVWNAYWNSRIHHLYDLGQTPHDKAYRGPSGPEFIRYILETRKINRLPDLVIEERNRDKLRSA